MAMGGRRKSRNRNGLTPNVIRPKQLESLTDEDLARRARSGDEVAWEILYLRSYDYLVSFAESLGWYADTAEDLAQETLLRAWRHRSRYNPGYSYRGWLRTILKRLSSTLYRREQAFGQVVSRARSRGIDVDWRANVPEDALEFVERRELGERIARVMASLRQDDREILMAWAGGARGQEIAAQHDVLPSTARGRLMRAKVRFAEAYASLYGAEPSCD